MAIVNRQNNLFAAESWRVAYKAYSQVNFQAYDFDTIRSALVEYIRTNFPENFNDYIESSEFIAIIELLAYLSQSIVFRMDLNSRENFLETAERRDSVFKLARMLGYNPKRNIPASGLMKITAVKTNEPLTDSLGTALNNKTIFWDDSNNPEAYEQFITVLNATMNSTNRFTSPIKEGTVSDIQTELYEINVQLGTPLVQTFNLNVNGVNRAFEVVNADFTDGGFFSEQQPDPLNNFGIVYRNDGQGISSPTSGFFVMFKQGRLAFQDFDYTTPIPNRTEDVLVNNINETDVFLQEINTTGSVIQQWTRISNTVGQTLNFNSQALGSRNLFSLENLDNDGIRVKYPDGKFGNIPQGIYRLYYRVSDGERYSLQPDDARSVTVNIPYENQKGEDYTLTVTFQLQSTVSNSLPSETLASIKERAPQTYYTQNRMISAQDYNVFPFSQSSNILKLTAINRTHAGHSRFIDINDPTGTFQNIEMYADDGYLYKEDAGLVSSVIVNPSNTTSEIIANRIPVLLKNQQLNNFVYDGMRKKWTNHVSNKFDTSSYNIRWKPLPTGTEGFTGYMTETASDGGGETSVLLNTFTIFKQLQENNFVKFVNTADLADYKWVRVISVDNNGALGSGLSTTTGPWKLSTNVDLDWRLDEVIVTLRKEFTAIEQVPIKDEMDAKRTFGLGYDIGLDDWYVIENKDLDKTSAFSVVNAKNTSGTGLDASWLLLFEFSPIDTVSYKYSITLRGERYVMHSKDELKFYNIKNHKVTDTDNRANNDEIVINTLNDKPGSVEELQWIDTTANGVGDAWQSIETGATHDPVSYAPNIPLRTRSTKWFDVGFSYKTNIGMLRGLGQTEAAAVTANVFVNQAAVPVNTWFDDGSSDATNPNVTIANNTGIISRIPGNINIAFNNLTFGYNLFTSTGNIVYRDYNPGTNADEWYKANISGVTRSFGADGLTYNGAAIGRLVFSNGNVITQSGNLIITNMENNRYTYATDSTLKLSQDGILLDYKNFKERLDQNIHWDVTDTFKYTDGYTDNRKVIIAPVDSDSDLVPDRPLQFDEYVDTQDLLLFEYYTDFDGYTYDRPVTGEIFDVRDESTLTIDFVGDTVSPASYGNPVTLSTLDWILVKDNTVRDSLENDLGKAGGLLIYTADSGNVWQLTPSSTISNAVRAIQTEDYLVRNGRGATQNTLEVEQAPLVFKWDHVAAKDVRIDPSISNVVEMLVLTNTYYDEVQKYINVPGTTFPLAPTSSELANEFENLNEFKSASDSLVFRSAKFKLLFGADADLDVQAKFRIVKLDDTLSDNEVKSAVIRSFNEYFNVANWEFGETFYFTELSTYIHQQLGSAIGSIVIIPKGSNGSFGELFQVKAEPDELFLNSATTDDIEIITKITSQTLRSDR